MEFTFGTILVYVRVSVHMREDMNHVLGFYNELNVSLKSWSLAVSWFDRLVYLGLFRL